MYYFFSDSLKSTISFPIAEDDADGIFADCSLIPLRHPRADNRQLWQGNLWLPKTGIRKRLARYVRYRYQPLAYNAILGENKEIAYNLFFLMVGMTVKSPW